MGAFKAGYMEDASLPPLGSENNAKFSIAFVLKVIVVFFSLRRYFYLQHN